MVEEEVVGIGRGLSKISGLTYWMLDRITGAEVFCSEDAGEGEGVAWGRGKGARQAQSEDAVATLEGQ